MKHQARLRENVQAFDVVVLHKGSIVENFTMANLMVRHESRNCRIKEWRRVRSQRQNNFQDITYLITRRIDVG